MVAQGQFGTSSRGAICRMLSVVGARPNDMKIASIVDTLKEFPDMHLCLVHSGQDYDKLLSEDFFSELVLPLPDVNLQAGSGSHAAQTAEVMRRVKPVLLDYQPGVVLVVGDVNSTLATALTAVKLGIHVAHIEALSESTRISHRPALWDGQAAPRIVEILRQQLHRTPTA